MMKHIKFPMKKSEMDFQRSLFFFASENLRYNFIMEFKTEGYQLKC